MTKWPCTGEECPLPCTEPVHQVPRECALRCVWQSWEHPMTKSLENGGKKSKFGMVSSLVAPRDAESVLACPMLTWQQTYQGT